MKFADYVLILAVAVCFIAALVYTLRRSKSGGCMGCGSGGGSGSSCCGKGGGNSPNNAANSHGVCAGCSSGSGCGGCVSFRPFDSDESSANYNIRTDNSRCR